MCHWFHLNVGRIQLDDASVPYLLMEITGCIQLVDGLVWRAQYSFVHISGALVRLAGKLSSAEMVKCNTYTWPLQYGSLRVG